MARNVEFDILARDKASKTFDHVAKSSDGLASKLGKFGGFAAAGIAGAATAVAGLGVAAAAMGVKTAAANEQASIAFTTMLGSGQKAQVFLKQLQQFAAQTPFEFPELQTAASSLISAGINANKVIPIMRTLGDVTSGMGTGSEGVKRATIALQQMNAAGKITGEDLNQLRDAGIPVYDLLSKATGKSKAEVVKLAQAGKLGQKELGQMMKALESGKGLERFAGLMDKQSHSLSGLWSTFKDTFNMGLAKAIEPLIPLLKKGLTGAAASLAAVLPKVAAALASVVRWVTGSVIPAVSRMWGWIAEKLWPALVKGYQTIMPGVKQALSILKGGVDGNSVSWKQVGDIIVNKVIPFLAGLARVWIPMVATNLRIIIEVVKAVWRVFQTMMTIVGGVIVFLLRRFADLSSMWAGVLRALSHVPGFGWAKGAADKMQAAANKARALATAIENIPKNTTLTVNTYFKTHGAPAPGSTQGSGAGYKGYATGGTNLPRGWRVVGEDGPELQYSPGGDTIIPSRQTKQLLSGGAGGGAVMAGSGGVEIHVHGNVMGDPQAIARELLAQLLKHKRQTGVNLGLA